jgi:hypothetical protein
VSTNPRSLDKLTRISDAYNSLFACHCAFLDKSVAMQTRPRRRAAE